MKRHLQGLYFVVDATAPARKVLSVTEAALRGGVNLLQVWSPRSGQKKPEKLASELKKLAESYVVPVIISNDVKLAKRISADGVHMDTTSENPESLRKQLGKMSIVGYTTGNDMAKVIWAERQEADYISFCSIFPSASAGECEIVPLETLRRARQLVRIPIFASGGINLDNAGEILETGIDGIAVVSAIQLASDPETVARRFRRVIDEFRPQAVQPKRE